VVDTTYRGVTFNKGDKVKVMAEWIEGKRPNALICGFQLNNGVRFARVKYLGADLSEELGTLFTLDELKKA